MSTPTIANLQRALAVAEQIQKLEAELASIMSGGSPATSAPKAASTLAAKKGKRTMSPATIAKMRASQQARWAMKKGGEAVTAVVKTEKKIVKKVKRTMSPEARARIVAAQKARWAKIKGTVVETAKAATAVVMPSPKKKAKRTISPEARAKMVAAAKKRWAGKKK